MRAFTNTYCALIIPQMFEHLSAPGTVQLVTKWKALTLVELTFYFICFITNCFHKHLHKRATIARIATFITQMRKSV